MGPVGTGHWGLGLGLDDFPKGKSGVDRSRLVLYQACLDPFSKIPKPDLLVWPVRRGLILLINIINISCNFYLFLYLEDKRKESTGISCKLKVIFHTFIHTFNELCFVLLAVVEVERERKRRNLIPARLGIYCIWVFAFHQISETFAYNAFRRSKVNARQPRRSIFGLYYLTLKGIRIPNSF